MPPLPTVRPLKDRLHNVCSKAIPKAKRGNLVRYRLGVLSLTSCKLEDEVFLEALAYRFSSQSRSVCTAHWASMCRFSWKSMGALDYCWFSACFGVVLPYLL